MNPLEFKNAFGSIKEREDKKWGKYFAFTPNALPPEIKFDKKLALSLSGADATLGKLSGVGLLLPNPNLLIMPYLRKEALLSSRIEGTRISLSELLLSEAKGTEENTPDAFEVINYIHAVKYGLEKIEKNQIDLGLIKEMHKILMKGVRGKDKFPGEYRGIQNWIGPRNCSVQEAIFVPPGPEDVTPSMNDLITYLNTDDGMPLLIKCALIHYQFETIPPFCDGNGRIGRALITLYLCKKNKISEPLLYASDYFEKHRREYYEILLTTNKTGKFEDWLKFFLEAIKVQSEDALERTIKIQKLRGEYQRKTKNHKQASNLLNVIDTLFLNPFIKTNQIAKELNVTYPTAKKAVDNLVKLEILRPLKKIERNKLFVAHEILNIITL